MRKPDRETPILFLHEFGGHHLSWEPQVRYFSRRYRCITYAARGWPPSDIPDSADRLLAGRAPRMTRPPCCVGSASPKAHLVGLSMGATAAHRVRHPPSDMALSLTAAAGRQRRLHRSGSQARFQAGMRSPSQRASSARACRRWPNSTAPGRRACSTATKTRAAGRNSSASSPRVRQGPRAHHDRRAEPARAAVRAQGGACRDPRADADHRRRRGRLDARPCGVPQAHDPALRPADAAEDRPRHQSGGAGSLQCRASRTSFTPSSATAGASASRSQERATRSFRATRSRARGGAPSGAPPVAPHFGQRW